MLAAAVNADLLIRLGISVSHLTGDLSRINTEAIRSGRHGSAEAGLLALTIAGFVIGATASGYFIHHPSLDTSRPYGRSIVMIGLLLLIAHASFPHFPPVACLIAATACGFQNALATRFRGLILRTTHITGLLTDFGQFLGMRLRGHHVDGWKIGTPLLLIVSFTTGSAIGAILNLRHHQSLLLLCGAAYVSGGILWSWIKRRPTQSPSNPSDHE